LVVNTGLEVKEQKGSMRRALIVAIFVLLVLGGGLIVGFAARPDAWYAALSKPPFNPPNWIFAPVWSLLYILIAVAGARTYERGLSGGFALWAVQLVLNFCWSPVFFALQRPGFALAIVTALLACTVTFIVIRWNADRASALLFLPYAAWVAFAALLNASIVALN
jgi:benzodiazapine receptor